jgi:hypothetical protein
MQLKFKMEQVHNAFFCQTTAILGLGVNMQTVSASIYTSDRPKTCSAEYLAENYRPNIRPKRVDARQRNERNARMRT